MKGQLPSGEAAWVEKRRRMRDQDILDDRDLLMLLESVQGRPSREIARMFKISRQLVWRRLSGIHISVVEGMKALVRRKVAAGDVVLLSSAEREALKVRMRRTRRGECQVA
jgi:DNA-binding Lrp family transcriptional regulator